MLQKEFDWRIEKDYKSDSDYKSRRFQVRDENIYSLWGLRLSRNEFQYPFEVKSEYVDLSLILHSVNKPVIKIQYKFVIMNTSVYPPVIEQTLEGELLFVKKKLLITGNSVDVSLKLDRSALDKKMIGYVIKCVITVLEIGSHVFITDAEDACSLAKDFSSLLKKQMVSDVVLISRDKQRFSAHRCVLAARNSVFASMFEHDMAENRDGVVEITDVDGEHLRRLLDYVYEGKFEDGKNDDIDIASGLLVAADKYGIDKLKASCAKVLENKLNVDNVLDVLVLAEAHGILELKNKCMDFIVVHDKVIKSTRFEEAKKTITELVIEVLLWKWNKHDV